ncbi:acetate--CoA ligase family protein [Desulfosediminicola flagellatus]|uniref:acetate--CoA ligase family protein n=1 Tax=Desulfosediminicola flagellatus TaxID=2569541 RepID=UPI0010AC7366|nr:acetate--CoA ligase [Desulfosediminicola flagellatus]
MLTHLFFPQTLALIGASRSPGKVGHDILANLVQGGFTGTIIPVNPAGGELFEQKVFTNLDEYDGTIDQAIIAVPKTDVIHAARQSLKKGARTIIVITAGFKETDQDGVILEREVAELCRRNGARLLGPNCLGLINSQYHLNASFAGQMPKKGNVSVFSQSGALCSSIIDVANDRDLGLSKLISIGNKADICENDLLEYLGNDPDTAVIVGYLENIVSGDSFIKVATETANRKPVIILKSGTSEVGRRAAASHTGVMAGTDTAYAAAFKRSGVIRADTFEALFDYATAFSMQPLPAGDRVLIISNAGGPGTMAADAVEHSGMTVAELASNTATSLREKLPSSASTNNPIDVLGDAPPERYGETLAAAQKDPAVDSIIIILTPQTMTAPEETAQTIARVIDGSKPVFVSFMGGKSIMTGRDQLIAAGLPDFPSPERAVAALKAMHQYAKWKSRPPRVITRFRVNRRRAGQTINRSRSNGIFRLSEVKAKKVLEAYGFTIPEGRLVTSRDEAVEHARHIGFPLAMKIASPDVIHKTSIGGVRLNITSVQQVKDSYDLMMLRIGQKMPEARVEGIYLERMEDHGIEVILGMTRDPQFGPMLMFGLGGIFVEVMKDVTFNLAPITHEEAIQMLTSTRSYDVLQGKAGRKGVDIDTIATALQRVSQLTTDFKEITELEINPFFVGEYGTEPVVADVRIQLSEPPKKTKRYLVPD